MQTRRENLVTMLALVSAPTIGILTLPSVAHAQSFDHSHQAWTALLQRHVRLTRQSSASQLHYAGMKADRTALKAYLNTLSSVSKPAFVAFTPAEQMAFHRWAAPCCVKKPLPRQCWTRSCRNKRRVS